MGTIRVKAKPWNVADDAAKAAQANKVGKRVVQTGPNQLVNLCDQCGCLVSDDDQHLIHHAVLAGLMRVTEELKDITKATLALFRELSGGD